MESQNVRNPIWNIMQEGTAYPVHWVEHSANPRFAIYDTKADSDSSRTSSVSDDLVLDRETGLVWARDANLKGQQNWLDSSTSCREIILGNRIGWRLPTIEEISSLVVPSRSDPALPDGHPFVNVQAGAGDVYWTKTNHENPDAAAWVVYMSEGRAGLLTKSLTGHIWPVRGGSEGNNWNV